jgi:hypothetical protein
MKAQSWSMGIALLFITSALDGGGWSAPRLIRFTLGERDAVPLVQEALLAPGPVWTGAENLAPAGHPGKEHNEYRFSRTQLSGCYHHPCLPWSLTTRCHPYSLRQFVLGVTEVRCAM